MDKMSFIADIDKTKGQVTVKRRDITPKVLFGIVFISVLLAGLLVWNAILEYRLQQITSERQILIAARVVSTLSGFSLQPDVVQYKRSNGFIEPVQSRKKCDKKKDRKKNGWKNKQTALDRLSSATKTLNNARIIMEKALVSRGRYHPSVHLSPVMINATVKQDDLRWTLYPNNGHSTDAQGQYTGTEHFFGMSENNKSIIIKRNGTYNVYAQLTFNGRRNTVVPAYIPFCEYSIYKGRRALLHSFVTQYKLSLPIRPGIYAHDSAYISGVFYLSEGDELEILATSPEQCDVRTERDKTFFGAFLLTESSN